MWVVVIENVQTGDTWTMRVGGGGKGEVVSFADEWAAREAAAAQEDSAHRATAQYRSPRTRRAARRMRGA